MQPPYGVLAGFGQAVLRMLLIRLTITSRMMSNSSSSLELMWLYRLPTCSPTWSAISRSEVALNPFRWNNSIAASTIRSRV